MLDVTAALAEALASSLAGRVDRAKASRPRGVDALTVVVDVEQYDVHAARFGGDQILGVAEDFEGFGGRHGRSPASGVAALVTVLRRLSRDSLVARE